MKTSLTVVCGSFIINQGWCCCAAVVGNEITAVYVMSHNSTADAMLYDTLTVLRVAVYYYTSALNCKLVLGQYSAGKGNVILQQYSTVHLLHTGHAP